MEVKKIIVKYADGSEKEIQEGFAVELQGKELCVDRATFSEQELYAAAFSILTMEFFREYSTMYPEKMEKQEDFKRSGSMM